VAGLVGAEKTLGKLDADLPAVAFHASASVSIPGDHAFPRLLLEQALEPPRLRGPASAAPQVKAPVLPGRAPAAQ
jgi:hypothetical protein